MINKDEVIELLVYLGWFIHDDSCADITASKLNTTLDITITNTDTNADTNGVSLVGCVVDILKLNDSAEDGLV